MVDRGQSWQRTFKGLTSQGRAVRQWTYARIDHPDAVQIAHELFVTVLNGSPDVIEMTLSTAGGRVRITALGPQELPVRHSHGPGRCIIAALSALCGTTPNGCGMWAQLTKE